MDLRRHSLNGYFKPRSRFQQIGAGNKRRLNLHPRKTFALRRSVDKASISMYYIVASRANLGIIEGKADFAVDGQWRMVSGPSLW
jgi:hypothetical protein